MTCRICGSRCIGDRCADCEQDAAAEARAGDDGGDSDDGGDAGDQGEATDDGNDGDPEGDVDKTFADLAPDWLDESSWWQAVEMADDLEDLHETLGWEDGVDELRKLVVATDAGEELDTTEGVLTP